MIYQDNDYKYRLAPIMTLYNYSFKPDCAEKGREVLWAAESGVICADENLLFSEPYATISEWCAYRCHYTEEQCLLRMIYH